MDSRPEWKAPPRERVTSSSPYQLSSTTLPSAASRSRERCRPAPVALVCTTRSRPSAACSGSAKSTPRASATAARVGSTSTSSTRTPGNCASSRATQQPTMPAPTTLTRSPGSTPASHTAFTAVSTVPASTARLGGTSSGTGQAAAAGTTYSVWCGWRQNTVRPRIARSPSLDDADAEVAVLHRAGELPLLEGRSHRRTLRLRHPTGEDQRLGAAADRRAQRAHAHLTRVRVAQGDRTDLTHPRLSEPESTCHEPAEPLSASSPSTARQTLERRSRARGSNARAADGGAGPGQPGHPHPGTALARGGADGRRGARGGRPRLPAGGYDGPGAGAGLGRRAGGPTHGHGDRVRCALRHGGRRVPDPGAQRVRRPLVRPVGAGDRARPLRAARRRAGLAVAAPPRACRGTGARWWPRSRAWCSPPLRPTVLPHYLAAVALVGALLLLAESFGRDVLYLSRSRPATR